MKHRPVFVFAPHRSNSTMLERMLNCHPDLVLWGEHGGLINNFAEIDEVARRFPPLLKPLTKRELGGFIRNKQMGSFEPWRTSVSLEGLRDAARDWMLQTFSIGLTPEQRWGVKEIRYGGEAITKFLLTLFPKCQILILRRNLVELCVSNILADWSIQVLRSLGSFESESDAAEVVADCAYALAAFDIRLANSSKVAGASALSLKSEELAAASKEIFEFLELPLNPRIEAEIARVVATRTGQTNKAQCLGRLNKEFILDLAQHCITQATADIEAKGLDRLRLMRKGEKGKYCFLVGDHNLVGSRFSSMGWCL